MSTDILSLLKQASQLPPFYIPPTTPTTTTTNTQEQEQEEIQQQQQQEVDNNNNNTTAMMMDIKSYPSSEDIHKHYNDIGDGNDDNDHHNHDDNDELSSNSSGEDISISEDSADPGVGNISNHHSHNGDDSLAAADNTTTTSTSTTTSNNNNIPPLTSYSSTSGGRRMSQTNRNSRSNSKSNNRSNLNSSKQCIRNPVTLVEEYSTSSLSSNNTNTSSLSTENIFNIIKEIEEAVNSCNIKFDLTPPPPSTQQQSQQPISTSTSTKEIIDDSSSSSSSSNSSHIEKPGRKLSISASSLPFVLIPGSTQPPIALSASAPSLPQTLTTTTTTTTSTSNTNKTDCNNNNKTTTISPPLSTSTTSSPSGTSSTGKSKSRLFMFKKSSKSSTTISTPIVTPPSTTTTTTTTTTTQPISKSPSTPSSINQSSTLSSSSTSDDEIEESQTATKKEKKKWRLSVKKKNKKSPQPIPFEIVEPTPTPTKPQNDTLAQSHSHIKTPPLSSTPTNENNNNNVEINNNNNNLDENNKSPPLAISPSLLSSSTPFSSNGDNPLHFYLEPENNQKGNSFNGQSLLDLMVEDEEMPKGGRGRSNAFYLKGTPSIVNGEVIFPPGPPSLTPKTPSPPYDSYDQIPSVLPKESSSLLSKPIGILSKFKKSSSRVGGFRSPSRKTIYGANGSRVVKHHSSRFVVGFADTIGRRPNMEDETVIYGTFRGHVDEDYFALFDGHGGCDVAKLAAAELHKHLSERLKANHNPVKSLKESFVSLNKTVSDRGMRGGTTAVVALFLGKKGYVANVGDSRAVLCRDGVAVRVSNDHKPNDPKEEERIKSLGGTVVTTTNAFTGVSTSRVNGQLAVSRALGDLILAPFVSCDPDIFGPINLETHTKNQFMIIACDGIWDVMTDDEAISIVAPISDPEKACMKLREIAYNRRSTDNISVMISTLPQQLCI